MWFPYQVVLVSVIIVGALDVLVGILEKLAPDKGLHPGQINSLFNQGLEMRTHVCIASVSCGRPILFNRTLSAVIGHLSNFEKKVIYKTVMIDYGKSNFKFLKEMQNTYNIIKLVVTENNEGIAFNLNTAFFSLCHSQFILNVRENWAYNGPDNYQAIKIAMELLNAVPEVLCVILCPDDSYNKTVPNPEIIKISMGPVKFQRHCYQNLWAAYINGASLYRTSSMYSLLGIQNKLTTAGREFAEYGTTVRASEIYCVAHTIRDSAEYDGLEFNAVFQHIGTEDSSPGHDMIPRPPGKPWGSK